MRYFLAILKTIYPLLVPGLLFITAYSFSAQWKWFDVNVPYTNNTLMQWDANWHKDVAESGYYFRNAQNNTAFFPLYSYIWHVSKLNYLGISLLNGFLFLSGSWLLIRAFNLDPWTAMVAISFPVNVFMLVPYAEATFFFFSAAFIYFHFRNRFYLSLAALFIAGLARSAFVMLIPAFLFAGIITCHRAEDRSESRKPFVWAAVSFASMLAVVLFQYAQTGVWFAFAKTQAYWNHFLQWPHIPFRTWDGYRMMKYDALGLFIGLSSASLCIYFLIRRFSGRTVRLTSVNHIWYVALGYLSMSAFYIVFFQGHTLFSLDRYIFATVFYVAFLIYGVRQQWPLPKLVALAVFANLVWMLCGAYQTGKLIPFTATESFWHFTLLTLYLLLHVLFTLRSKGRIVVYALLLLVNTYYSCVLLNSYLLNKWIG